MGESKGVSAEAGGRSSSAGARRLPRLLGAVRFACCLGLLGLVAIPAVFTGAQSQLAWSVTGLVTLVVAAVLLATTLRRPRRLPAPRVLIALALLALLLLVQLAPLPASVVGALSPRRAELAAQAEAALGRSPPTSVALTLSTKTTRDALCLLAVYAFAFLASSLVFREPRRVRLLFAALAVSGAVLAAWGGVRVLAASGFPLTSTYTNRNRFAALLAMALFAAVGWVMLSLRGGLKRERAAAAVCAGAIALGTVMTLSRMGLASVSLSLMLLALIALRGGLPGASGPDADGRTVGHGRGRRLLLLGASLTVSVMLASLLTSLDPVLARYSLLFDGGLARPTCWRMSLGIVRDFPLFGSGAGSFRYVFPLYQRAGELSGFWKYAHSDPLNTLTDLGPAGLVLVLAACFLWFRSAWRGFGAAPVSRRIVAWVGMGAVTAALFHSLADFVLRQPANALVFSVLSGAVAGSGRSLSRRRLPRPLVAALALTALVFAALLVQTARAGYWMLRAETAEPPDRRAEALENALRCDPRDGETRHAAAQAIAARGEAERAVGILGGAPPGETVDARALYLFGAASRATGDAVQADIAMRVAAEFASAYDDVTFKVGVYFLRRWIETRGLLRVEGTGPLDLSLEYLRRSCLVSRRRLGPTFDLLSSAPESAARLVEIVPPDPASRIITARYLRRAGRVPEARQVLEAVAEGAGVRERGSVMGLLADLRDETGDTEGALAARLSHVMATPVESRPAAASRHVDRLLADKRAADARLFVGALRRRHPAEPAGLYAEARYAAASGSPLVAYRGLLEYVEHSVDAEGHHRLADAALKLGRLAEAESHAGRAIELAPGSARYLLARAGIREAAGKADGAALDLRAALDVNPANARVRRRLASLHLGSGRPLQAATLWREATERSPDDASAHLELARACHAAGLDEDAAAHACRVLEIATEPDARRKAALELLWAMDLGDGQGGAGPGESVPP
jgi:tetratricopeptide (TPR) repeat protein